MERKDESELFTWGKSAAVATSGGLRSRQSAWRSYIHQASQVGESKKQEPDSHTHLWICY